jgi:DNA-binding transcriptional LysR family regulator
MLDVGLGEIQAAHFDDVRVVRQAETQVTSTAADIENTNGPADPRKIDEQRCEAPAPAPHLQLIVVGRSFQLTAKGANVEIAMLANCPLLVLDTSFIFRRTFDAACRLARLQANVVFESRMPHTLLAMAEAGHGVAIVPSALRIDRYPLRIARVTYQGKPLREPLAIFWDARRPLPRYAEAFCETLAAHVRKVFPISRPPGHEHGASTWRKDKRRRQ